MLTLILLFSVTLQTVFRYSHRFYLFPVLARILPFSVLFEQFFSSHTDSTLFWNSSGKFFDTRSDSNFSQYLPEFYHFLVLTLILIFFGTRLDSFSVLARILPFRVLALIPPISVLTLTLPFSGTRLDNFSIVARILHFFGTRPNSTIFTYSHGFYPFPVLPRTVFQYSHKFYLFPILARILPFFGTHTDSTPFRYLPRQFFGTRMDSTFSRYSPGF